MPSRVGPVLSARRPVHILAVILLSLCTRHRQVLGTVLTWLIDESSRSGNNVMLFGACRRHLSSAQSTRTHRPIAGQLLPPSLLCSRLGASGEAVQGLA